jgi:hypothetical protein
MSLDPLRTRRQCGIGNRNMVGILETLEQLLHRSGFTHLTRSNHNLKQLTFTLDTLL